MTMRGFGTFLAFLGLLYLCACLALYFYQRSLIYFPQPAAFGAPESTLRVPVPGATLAVSVRPHAGPKALIYFGGNAEDVSSNLPAFSQAFPEHALYLMHYRGYGGSSGQPSEELLHADARALFDLVRLSHPDVALIGRSLGSGVAVRLASERPASVLVLVTPYDSIERIAAAQFAYFPVAWILTDKFESWRYAPAIRVPTLLLLAEHDELIPRASSARLRAAFTGTAAAQVVVAAATHNSIGHAPAYLPAIRGILKRDQ
ncbi:MAG: alpha/beta hydrolase [Pseudomonadota bacterium]